MTHTEDQICASCNGTGNVEVWRNNLREVDYLICRDPEKKLFVKEDVVLHEVRKAFQSIQIPENILAAITDHLKQSFDAEKKFYREARKEPEIEAGKITDKLDTLLDMLLEKKISQEVYDRKSRDLMQRRDDIDYQRSGPQISDSMLRSKIIPKKRGFSDDGTEELQ